MGVDSLVDQLPNHCDQSGMASDDRRPDHVQTGLFARGPGFHVQVPNNLHMLGQEADRHNHHVACLAALAELG